MKKPPHRPPRVKTGVPALDTLLDGGLPKGTMTVLAGPPGAGKTTLAQQICFANASVAAPVLIFTTLSESAAKLLLYLEPFSYFEPEKFNRAFHTVDLGAVLRAEGLQRASEVITESLERVRPAFVVIDSFKVFDDLAASASELRRFSYEVAINLMAWECTTLLLGEYGASDLERNPVFSVIDGLIWLKQQEIAGEPQRLLQIVKMRGTSHSRDGHPFIITARGVELVASKVRIESGGSDRDLPHAPVRRRLRLGIPSIDALLGPGIPSGTALMVAGAAGTGKTALGLQAAHASAKQFGERCLYLSFQQSAERLLASSEGLGFDLQPLQQQGLVRVIAIPQTDIRVDEDLIALRTRLIEGKFKRLVIDSTSFFFRRLPPAIARDKVYVLASLLEELDVLGILMTDVAFGAENINRFESEDTVADGVFILEACKEGRARKRYFEVYKLRDTPHVTGSFPMQIGPNGIEVLSGKSKRTVSKRTAKPVRGKR